MRIVVAPDSFKGTLTAEEAGEAIRLGILDAHPDAEIEVIPLADGGEGTAAVARLARGGRWNALRCTGPLPGETVEAGWLHLEGEDRRGEALVEMASASGLNLLPPSRRDPLRTTTRGTGELLRAAAEAGCESLRLAVGGSATVDGGMGVRGPWDGAFWTTAVRMFPTGVANSFGCDLWFRRTRPGGVPRAHSSSPSPERSWRSPPSRSSPM